MNGGGLGSQAPTIVIGVGNTMRGDDGVGPAAAEQLASRLTDEKSIEVVVLCGEASGLIDAWTGRRRAVLVDAVATGAPAGTVHELVMGTVPLPDWRAGFGTHSAGLGEAIALGRALGRVPLDLRVIGVELADVGLGNAMSPAVAAAIPDVVERILAYLAEPVARVSAP